MLWTDFLIKKKNRGMLIMEQGSDNCIHVFVHITILGFGNELLGMALFLDYSFFRVLFEQTRLPQSVRKRDTNATLNSKRAEKKFRKWVLLGQFSVVS